MNYIFHPEANQEFLEAIDYYESKQPGLGEDYHAEIMATVARISRNALAWPILVGDVRRCLSHRFPYGVLYSVDEGVVYILAVMHLRREPDYWRDRMVD